jgi:hypothetical protein
MIQRLYFTPDVFHINSSGRLYPKSEAEDRDREWANSFFQKIVENNEICDKIMALGDEDDTPLPPYPMQVFPEATAACILGLDCHHRVYSTHDTSTSTCHLPFVHSYSLCFKI